MTDKLRRKMQELLSQANIKINGNRSWDIQIHNENFYRRVLSHGALGLGESYMDGWWDVKKLDEFFNHILKAELDKKVKTFSFLLQTIKAILMNPQRKSRAFKIGEHHYDIGNELYKRMLDKRLTYTCGYWKNSNDLDSAQEAKLDLVCRKIGLKPGMTVLDIGCGWGSFAKYAAEKYKAKVTGITVSKAQVELGKKLCRDLPVKFQLIDYRDVKGKYDRVVSLGMFEHVGYKNYRRYIEIVHRLLKDDGIFLLHTIGRNVSVKSNNQWTEKYIFPNSMLPSIAQIGKSIEGLFVMEDWHNFGADYDKTLMAWHDNFKKGWKKLRAKHKKYDERFRRMWNYYLLSSAGSFRARDIQLWQIVLAKKGVPKGYDSVR